MRNQKKNVLFLNTFSSIGFQVVSIICGFIIPRLILRSYGSVVNGAVTSIQQFLQVVTFLELGMGAVVRSSLYEPLACGDSLRISQIYKSASLFFRRIAQVLLIYVGVLVVFYPRITEQALDWGSTVFLIGAMSVSSFAQYYFGIVNQLLITADQKGYIHYVLQTVTLLFNTLACAVLINLGASIQIVKLTTSVIYLLRPMVMQHYVNKHYSIDKTVTYQDEPIKQKWNGLAQHVAAIVLDSTDVLVLTIWGSFELVSVYYVYHLVVNGIKQLFHVTSSGIQAALGALYVKGKAEELQDTFGWIEWLLHSSITVIYSCAAVLILPFVSVYTKNINDTNYIVPLFASLIVAANAVHTYRTPYHAVVLAAGHYKQTQLCYLISALLNLIISVLTVMRWGLVGVAIGTIIGMGYNAIWLAIYAYRYILKRSLMILLRQFCADVIVFAFVPIAMRFIPGVCNDYLEWIKISIISSMAFIIVWVVVNFAMYKKYLFRFARQIVKK